MALGGDCVGETGGGGCRVEAKGGGTMLGRDEGGDDEFAIFTQLSPRIKSPNLQISES